MELFKHSNPKPSESVLAGIEFDLDCQVPGRDPAPTKTPPPPPKPGEVPPPPDEQPGHPRKDPPFEPPRQDIPPAAFLYCS